MTQEQKQFIIKALQSGIPALAKGHIDALEELVQIDETKQEELEGAEDFKVLNQLIYENTISVLNAVYPFMAQEFIFAYADAVRRCNAKFAVNVKVRLEKEEAEKKAAEVQSVPTEGEDSKKDEKQSAEKKKKSA